MRIGANAKISIMNYEISKVSIVDAKVNNYGSYENWIELESTIVSADGMFRSLEIDPLIGLPTVPKEDLSPDLAIAMLYEGNQRFIQQVAIHPHQDKFRVESVAKGQNPFATILGCADSRVPVEIIFDRGLGDLFVVRNAGNIVTDTETGSLEYGAFILGTKAILVLGHARCGAVKGAVQSMPLPGKISGILTHIKPAVDSTANLPGDRVTNVVIANVKNQIRKLKSSRVLAELIEMGELKIIGGFYDLDTGVVKPIVE